MSDHRESDEDSRDSDANELLTQSLGAALAVGVGSLLVPGPVGGVLGAAATPYGMRLAANVLAEVRGERAASAGQIVDLAAEDLGVTVEQLDDLAHATPSRLMLVGEALEAGWKTRNERKVRALARAVANGLRSDEALVETERIVVTALADIEEPHVKVLLYMLDRVPRAEDDTVDLTSQAPVDAHTLVEQVFDPDGKSERPVVVRPIMSALARNYMVVPPETDSTSELNRIIRTVASLSERLKQAKSTTQETRSSLSEIEQELKELRATSAGREHARKKGGSFTVVYRDELVEKYSRSALFENYEGSSMREVVAPPRDQWLLTQFGVECAIYLSA